ncbi:PIN/TRAM domain-containing protein [Serpentinicella sp. ANB-PHB4]|uniref:PIN/TRAM domain-containing protein n=1 Tax=Serpentinicella sp. ANB-PHB4 TaxID=3074076 RepID=UPI00285546AC|nr:PIN/TRAM domain-containing protein [Serpentinicella sp. ANB-PHB4]MDR5659915.1 PIN/TRAM domain-containing protein [Serpentinicella sp. ANB-PHB4]
MINRFVRGVLTVLGAFTGYIIYFYVNNLFESFTGITYIIGIILSSLAGGILLFLASPWLIKKGRDVATWIENELANVPITSIILGSVGLIVGLIIAHLISQLLNNTPTPIGTVLSTVIYIFMGYLGITISTKKTDEIMNIPNMLRRAPLKERDGTLVNNLSPKILDTSVIIDGRIADICKTGFIEGPLVVPEFVLKELQQIADSSLAIKRNRGRRGLDILNLMQKELNIEVKVHTLDFEDIQEVDSKLLKLAQTINGKVLTNDYNLNKVAEFQGVHVLNINELANAIKPVVLPGEEMQVQVIKDGKESGQGLAYLDDGTMIVVEGGKKYIGQDIEVLVTSVLQTAAGRMIFAKPKSMVDKSA